MSDVDADVQVSHTEHGRTLSGVGVSADQLAETMERHAPEPAPETTVPPSADTPPVSAEPPQLTKGRQIGRREEVLQRPLGLSRNVDFSFFEPLY